MHCKVSQRLPTELIHPMDLVRSRQPFRHSFSDHPREHNLEHAVWQEFDKKYKIGFEFKEDITDIDLDKEVIALWFFRERSDRYAGPHIDLSGKKIAYTPNTFILTKTKDIKVIEAKKKYIRRPMVQLDISGKIFDNICGRFK